MGHQPGDRSCDNPNPLHGGQCSIAVVPPPADLGQTRFFEVASSIGGQSYWRTNTTAARGMQVEFWQPDGQWMSSLVFDTETALLKSFRSFEDRLPWREITAEEVPDAG